MSAINNALSQLSQSQTVATVNLEKAQVPTIKRANTLPWLVGGFTLSLAVGGWAISQQALPHKVDPTDLITHIQEPIRADEVVLSSPTSKLAQASEVIYDAPITPVKSPVIAEAEMPLTQPLASTASADVPRTAAPQEQSVPITKLESATSIPVEAPVNLAKVSQPAPIQEMLEPQVVGEVLIEQVELSPSQLAEKAVARAQKALDANNLDKAFSGFNEALRYTPRDATIRQTLAALYYGKGDARKAAELLQKGISLAQDDQALRLALAKLLLKEKQDAAALTPLVYLPSNPSIDYLSLRAALAQKNAQDDLALNSYQQLVQIDADNGRWWLGLGIQLERSAQFASAEQAYQQALTKVGLSSQSHQFIRDRIAVLGRLEE